MKDLFKLILGILASLFKSRANLEAEILILRQQINVLRRQAPKRPHFNNTDRFLLVCLYRWFPSVLGAIAIVRPETIIRWHRAGFQAYWRWRSRSPVGRPKVSAELRTLIGEMSRANPLWGAPHIHGELLKLGFEVAQSTVARYRRAFCCCAVLINSSACISSWNAVDGAFSGGAGGMNGSGGRIWIFIATPSQHPPPMSVAKHARQCLDDHGRARSRPRNPDDMSNEFEMRRRIDGLLFPIGKICRTRTFRCVQQASDRKPSDELGQFIDERLVDGDAERLLRK